MSKQTYKVCFCFRRRFKLAATEAPPPIKSLFEQYSDNNGIMTVDHLQRFLVEVQKQEKASVEDAQAIMNTTAHLFHRKGFNLETFFKYLFGESNPALEDRLVHHDMTAPLSHYFIFTGHNSYLTGNQLSSDCSFSAFTTLTTPVELIKCLRSIKAHAFTASEYPVVITLEDHLTTDLQAKVAKMVTETFGDMLFTPDAESLSEFRSPESLKKRVIISTKPPKEYLKSQESKAGAMGSQRENDAATGAWGGEIPSFKSRSNADFKHEDLEDEFEEEEDLQDDNCAPEYRNLIAIHAGKGKGGLDDWLKVDPDKVRRLSLSEQELEKAAKTHGPQIVRFTQRNILRVYPKGIRFDSSNYNPLIGWMHGAQMVAFNMQGYGRSLWVMQGMFKANGGCGYVKKPEILMKNEAIFDPRASLPVKITLKVTVYMGEGWYYDFSHTHFDAYSPPDFYTRVGIAGVPADTIMKRTKAIEDNWIPAWNEQFEFPLTVPELALLRIEVHEYDMSEKDDFGGQTCLPISELRKGIRAVPLYSQKGDKYKSVKLLMHFDFV
ncbi:phosphoinositide phospholipase C 2-like protein [Tanacetum coccineum]